VVLKVWWVFFLKFYTQKTKFPKISEFLCRHGAKIRQKKKKKKEKNAGSGRLPKYSRILKIFYFLF
jgi:hypothetical protein